MSQKLQTVAVFGGTFDPVHLGHVRVIHAALKALNPQRLIVVPAFQNPLKKNEPRATSAQRVQMCKKIFSPIRRVSVCMFEVKKNRPVYTIETLRYIRKRFGGNKHYVFICGSDTVKNLSRWKDIDKLCKMCSFAVVDRPGAKLEKLKYVDFRIPMQPIGVKARDIRSQMKTKQLKELNIPVQLIQWIKDRNLYGYKND